MGEIVFKNVCKSFGDTKVIENLDLSKIKDGNYTLVALPIKIEGAEASPTRVVLLEQEKGL